MEARKPIKKTRRHLLRASCILLLFLLTKSAFTQGRILINEYLSWPANSCSVTSEYIELYNFGPGPVDLGCYILTDGDYAITIPPNTIVQPGQFFVIAGQNSIPLGCANANQAVTVNLNWNTCNCTSGSIPATGDGFMTDGGAGSEQLVLLDPSLKVIDAIVRTLSETSAPITTSSLNGQCSSHTFDLDTMNINYEMVGESQGRANSFARRVDGGCGWLKDPQQSGGATNNTPGATSGLDASLAVTSSYTCTNTGSVTVSINSGTYSQIFPVNYTLARDIDSNNVYNFSDSYVYGTDSTSNIVPVNSLVPGIYRMVVETKQGCDLTGFNFNILGCHSSVLQIQFTSFEPVALDASKIRLVWKVSERDRLKSFSVERSIDGNNFFNYANISNIHSPEFASSFFLDRPRPAGKEFYRVILHTLDGNTLTSNVAMVDGTMETRSAPVYPNPFSDIIKVPVPTINPGVITVSVHDAFGKTVVREVMRTSQGQNTVTLNTRSLKPGIYIIHCESTQGKHISSAKIVKTL